MKVLNFTFCGGREHKNRLSFSFHELRYSLLELKTGKNLPTFDAGNSKLNEMEQYDKV